MTTGRTWFCYSLKKTWTSRTRLGAELYQYNTPVTQLQTGVRKRCYVCFCSKSTLASGPCGAIPVRPFQILSA